ncbi:inositol monophosphatase family protein [Pseudotabrizicola algicola]|uniref:Inositol-1-monophosphatase n=1 Tax=Pseudotabrizicola algicola TaxID=2709381 RepID=A0A6B3RJZ9_9RHOB|nr:inositol monophosphatase family protein [Pseudotabrizicola algicola]NEX46334.1 inositol monophosphatase [Pseudotabrizicola algicola]
MTDPIQLRFDLARQLATSGGALALSHFQNRDRLVIEAKANPHDIVSRADREVEDLIRAGIAASFPQDAILGEEGGAQTGDSGFLWVIDPIDGTSPFLAGLPHWCVIIALVQGSETVAAVTAHPLSGEVFTAIKGRGAWLNDAPMRCDPAHRITNSLVAIGASHRTDAAHVGGVITGLMQAGGIFYRNGSGGLMLASVAAGRLGGYYEPHMNPWDCLAGGLMIVEAGGRILPMPTDPAGGVALGTAPGVWDDLSAVVAKAPPDPQARRA